MCKSPSERSARGETGNSMKAKSNWDRSEASPLERLGMINTNNQKETGSTSLSSPSIWIDDYLIRERESGRVRRGCEAKMLAGWARFKRRWSLLKVCSKFGLPILSLVITADIANNATVPGELLIETDAVHWLRSTRLVALSRFLISPDKRTDNWHVSRSIFRTSLSERGGYLFEFQVRTRRTPTVWTTESQSDDGRWT